MLGSCARLTKVLDRCIIAGYSQANLVLASTTAAAAADDDDDEVSTNVYIVHVLTDCVHCPQLTTLAA